MPKHASTAHNGAQRGKSQAQKNIKLVRSAQNTDKITDSAEETISETEETTVAKENTVQEAQNTPRPGSAAAKIAARRQAMQKAQQRAAATLITTEHFAYVKQDLIRIGIFAVIMFTAIIVLYFTVGHA